MRALKSVVFFILLMIPLFALAEPEEGIASFYADSLQGNLTASGEPYDKDAMTAAHRTLPFGTRVKISNMDNAKSVEVKINDRGQTPSLWRCPKLYAKLCTTPLTDSLCPLHDGHP